MPIEPARLELLSALARKALWLSSWTIHHANHVRAAGEVKYYDTKNRWGRTISGEVIGQPVAKPYSECVETMDANGGWIASAVDLMRFARAFDDPKKCPVLSEATIETMLAPPPGTVGHDEADDDCARYEQLIRRAGGIDLQVLGIGRTGHVGFNEPGSGKESRTRLITLDRVTRIDAASDFFGQEHVPRRAITMGVGSILAARQIIMLAFGEHKAPIIAKAVEGEITPTIAASFLQEHPNALVVMDEAAADAAPRPTIGLARSPTCASVSN